MQNFETGYANLNEEQKKAVDHVDGPLLVLAGPGTGKTQLLSLRAAQILRKTEATAANILCLTYTNKAAINMRERLLALIGPEANAITVKTVMLRFVLVEFINITECQPPSVPVSFAQHSFLSINRS